MMELLKYVVVACLITLGSTVILCRRKVAHKKTPSFGALLAGILCGAIITAALTPVLDTGTHAFTHDYWAKLHTGYGRPITTVFFGWCFTSALICIFPATGVVIYFRRQTRVSINGLIAVSALLLLFCIYGTAALLGARCESSSNACVNNLRIIDAAKDQWALEKNKTTNDTPTWSDLWPYIGRGGTNNSLRCPLGGTYIIGRIGAVPKCSLGGYHVFDQ